MQSVNHPGRATAIALGVCAATLLIFPLLKAQTVRPVIAEYRLKGRGRIDLVNNSVVPLTVVLEPKSFSVGEDGMPAFRPLDKGIHLRLSQMSLRIPPQQTQYVFYEATADHYPSWFVVYATFAGLPQQSGLNVQLELPHTVYLLQKEPLEAGDIRITAAEFLSGEKKVQVEVENAGVGMGRVTEIEIRGGKDKTKSPGFPMLPAARRKIKIDWKSDVTPQRAIVQFRKFKVEMPIQERRN